MNSKTKKKYVDMLKNNEVSMEEIMQFTVKYVPERLFRYMGFGEYWKNNLINGEIHLSKPKEFNDPFDSVPFVDFRKFWNDTGSKILKENKGFCFELDGNTRLSDEYVLYKEMIDVTQEEMRVCCFTEQNESLLMWAHYADSHKGFCIEYNTSKIPDIIKQYIFPVNYQENIYNSTYDLCQNSNNMFNFLLFKNNIWKYEKEWRIAVYRKQITKDLNFSDYISSVFLGIKCEEKNKKEVCEWAEKKGINVYQERVNYDRFNIKMEQII